MNASIRGTLESPLFCGVPLPVEAGTAITGKFTRPPPTE